MRKITLLLLGIFASWHASMAQSSDWTLGAGATAFDFGVPAKRDLSMSDWNWGAYITASKRVHPMIQIAPSLSVVEVRNFYEIFPDRTFTFGSTASSFQASIAGQFHPLTDKKFDPYLSIGGGLNVLRRNSYGLGEGAVGINYWVDEAVAINVQAGYNYMFDFDNYLHYRGGFRFGLAKPVDTDGDGIPDKKDKCPNEKGTDKRLAGCPDSDNDGIIDSEDACPNDAGTAEFKGCPDRDGDKVIDKDDACPDEAGLAALNGCPDKDGDGIADKDDACPDQAGLATLQGCPDRDGDGIADKDDACPDAAGKRELNGCPDRDGDGIADKDDKCPDVPGVPEEQGCPRKVIEEKQLEDIAKKINFATGKATILKTSFAQLDELARLMAEYPETVITIEGHTDNVGNAAANKKLSQQRADAIKQYLIKKKVPANRMTAIGYGSERPADGSTDVKAANQTKEQRAANRRVEIHGTKK
jgi:outer membrane protein OmpA-like peptidoglycan-associated protein